jgi:hypothetical protein
MLCDCLSSMDHWWLCQKNIARVGETTIASSARIPDVPFWTNSQPAPEIRGTLASANESAMRPDGYSIFV